MFDTHVEAFREIDGERTYYLFDYRSRDPVTGNVGVIILTEQDWQQEDGS